MGQYWIVEIIFLWVNEISTQVWGWILTCSFYDVKLAHSIIASVLFQEKYPSFFPTLAKN